MKPLEILAIASKSAVSWLSLRMHTIFTTVVWISFNYFIFGVIFRSSCMGLSVVLLNEPVIADGIFMMPWIASGRYSSSIVGFYVRFIIDDSGF